MTNRMIEEKDERFWAETPIATLGPILNTIGVAVFVIDVLDDESFKISFINKYYERTFGVSASETAGRLIQDAVPKDTASHVVANYKRCIASREIEQYDEDILLQSGSFCARTVLTPLSIEGNVIRIIGTTNDITDRRQMEFDLASARDQAEVANRAKSSFMANMSHELRTPLNAVIGYSEMIQSEIFGSVGSPKYKEYLEDIKFAGKHLLDIVNDILDLAQIESGRSSIENNEVAPEKLMEDAMRLVESSSRPDQPSVTYCRNPAGIQLRVDEKRMRQCLINLLANARKFTPASGNIYFSCQLLADGQFCFRITDTGRGISAADLPKALSPFGRIDSEMDSTTQGAGLGLPITKAFVEQHDGALFMNSHPNIGTTAFILLPADRVLTKDKNSGLSPEITDKSLFLPDGNEFAKTATGLPDHLLNQLPSGSVLLSSTGEILLFNPAETSPNDRWESPAIGSNFFNPAAYFPFSPCFHTRFQEVSKRASASEVFSHAFHLQRQWNVLIEMRPDKGSGNVWLFIRWS
tara:strand:+ start:3751 stop:5325 length:1575 start_codon:yes stop_codon:yes gene_type:complete